MRYIRYLLQLIGFALAKTIVLIARGTNTVGIFPNSSQSIISANAYGEGAEAYRKGDYSRAKNILEPITKYQIDSSYVGSAQYLMGLLYFYGLGVPKDMQVAEDFFTQAAKHGSQEAKEYLRKYFQEGA